MSDEMDIFLDQYDQEIKLIKANGNHKQALRLRYDQYYASEKELLQYIKRHTLEHASRKAALDDFAAEVGE